ncbi:MAG: YfhO family protein [Actinomycetota bacterium]|nr:YfhO family protein [Actinomycetota bacterium]
MAGDRRPRTTPRVGATWPVPAALALALALALAAWLSAGAWGGAGPPGDDTAARLVGTAAPGIDRVLAEGRVDGWQTRFGLGYQAFLFIGPGLAWSVAAVRGLSLGLLSAPGAYTAVVVGSFVALPAAVAFLARSFGLDRRAAGLAALLTLAVGGPLAGVGLHSQFEVALVTNGLGALWWCLALGAIVRQLGDPRPRWVLLAATTGAALVLTHVVSALVLALVATLVVGLNAVLTTSPLGAGGGRLAVVRRLGVSAGLALGLAGVMVVPLVAHHDLHGAFTGLDEPSLAERLGQLWRGEVVVGPGVAPWVLAGLVAGGAWAVARRRPGLLALVLVPPVYLVVAHLALARWPDSLAARQLPTRGLGYLAILALLPLSGLLAEAGRRLGREGDAAAVVVAGALVVLPLGWPLPRPGAARPEPALRAAAARLAELVPDGARFATQRDFPDEIEATGVSHPDLWLAWLSGRDTLNIFNAESTIVGEPVFEPERIGHSTPAATADALARLGVTHLVLVDEAEAPGVVRSPRFELVWRSPPLAILALEAPPGQPPPSSLLATALPARARLVQAEAEHLVIEVATTVPTPATVALGWSPKWHVRLDGRPVPLGRTLDGLVSLALPAGEHTLVLDFRPDLWDRLGLALSLASALGAAGWFSRRRRRQARRTGPGPGSSRAGRVPSR